MNRSRKILTATLFALCFFSSDVPAGTIAGSPHDFRENVESESGILCQPCHTPHQSGRLPLPLWDPELPTDTYLLYESVEPPLSGAEPGILPGASSKICLSCHDGTIAFENYGDISEGAVCRHAGVPVGTDLGNDHPVSIVYDTPLSVANGGLHDPRTRRSGILDSEGTIDEDMLFQGRVECSSCHDVHNTKAVDGTRLLLKGNAGSALCLTCHDK